MITDSGSLLLEINFLSVAHREGLELVLRDADTRWELEKIVVQ